MSRLIAVDFSLSCPCVCILADNKSFIESEIYFQTTVKKYADNWDNITGIIQKPYKNNIERYSNLSNAFIDRVKFQPDDVVFMEDYALGAKGLVWNIGENTGIFKYKLYEQGVNLKVISPTVIKKFLTGKGNSDKNKMYDAFVEKTGINLRHTFGCYAEKIPSPISDIVDAYALALLGDTL